LPDLEVNPHAFPVAPIMLIAKRTTILCISLSLSLTTAAQQKPSRLAPYVKEDAAVLVLEHVRVIDGTGSAPQEDMRIDIAGGKITAVQAASAHSSCRIDCPGQGRRLGGVGREPRGEN
jgi:hypothetical protein